MARACLMLALFGAFIYWGLLQQATAQSGTGLMEPTMSGEELAILFGSFVAAVAGIAIFLARDVLLRRKTSYDSEEFESKKDKTYEKYHSDWNDDYDYIGSSKSDGKGAARHREFLKAARKSELPDYYRMLDVQKDATPSEIKAQYRRLAKKMHPDRTNDAGAEDAMAEINEAYEILSDPETRAKYDGLLD